MEGFKFRRGMAVEVNLDEENSNDDWFPAIFLQKFNLNSFMVECYNFSNKEKSGPMEVMVDSFHIRPPPPNLEFEKFELLEKVEAFYDSAWRLGTITKVLIERSYTVFLGHGKREKEFSHSEIRPRMNFMDGNWVSNSKKMEGFKFRRGMAVEVNLAEENSNDDWFPATFLQKVNFNSFLVDCYNSSDKDKSAPMEVMVDSFHIRPPPPNLEFEKV